MEDCCRNAKRQKTHYKQYDSCEDGDAPYAEIVMRRRLELISPDVISEIQASLREQQRTQEQLRADFERQSGEIRNMLQAQQIQNNAAMQNILTVVHNIQSTIAAGCFDRNAAGRADREASNRPQPVQRSQSPRDADSPRPVLSRDNGNVIIAVGREDINPDVKYAPVQIPADEYDTLVRRTRTPTAFLRGLIGFYFTPDVLKRSNYAGTTVVTKDGQIKKDCLDRRLVLSMLDHVELEFPGEVWGKHFAKMRDVINDKCRHT